MSTGSWNALVTQRWLGSQAPAIVDDDGVVTGDELMGLAAGAAAMFDGYGYAVGDAIPVLMDEDRTAIALVVGGGLSRRPVAPLGTKLSLDELALAVRGLGARHLFASAQRMRAGRAGRRRGRCRSGRHRSATRTGDTADRRVRARRHGRDRAHIGHHRSSEADPAHAAAAWRHACRCTKRPWASDQAIGTARRRRSITPQAWRWM